MWASSRPLSLRLMTQRTHEQLETRLEARGDWPVWSRPPLLWVRVAYLSLLNAAFSALYRLIRSRRTPFSVFRAGRSQPPARSARLR
jgi:hypothetical protein